MANLTNLERDTIISFKEAEPFAEIFTYNSTLTRNLEAYAEADPENCVKYDDNGNGGVSYRVPKKRVMNIRPPRKVSEEQRTQSRERMRAMRDR